uniref:GYF domain-containing protein n=1 Tax=Chromera velia CCMP2878 TaxID=1169474 RepID=A0A0G4GCP9_9ALVE|eukprot:Cvel_4534.t1-p1 / transcript=Cvel_4534.t1 / gene=Cvel_4534 / organism=Chromera_velia_CCMP2878 / gene_product=hypothetical protein / transcript_product=hypothetical protein / location=Cvel_scaffold198:100020-110716(+) / protein_length=2004 / sequence_SO=supercontig / SO=protein_coding / is_pseudo=false
MASLSREPPRPPGASDRIVKETSSPSFARGDSKVDLEFLKFEAPRAYDRQTIFSFYQHFEPPDHLVNGSEFREINVKNGLLPEFKMIEMKQSQKTRHDDVKERPRRLDEEWRNGARGEDHDDHRDSESEGDVRDRDGKAADGGLPPWRRGDKKIEPPPGRLKRRTSVSPPPAPARDRERERGERVPLRPPPGRLLEKERERETGLKGRERDGERGEGDRTERDGVGVSRGVDRERSGTDSSGPPIAESAADSTDNWRRPAPLADREKDRERERPGERRPTGDRESVSTPAGRRPLVPPPRLDKPATSGIGFPGGTPDRRDGGVREKERERDRDVSPSFASRHASGGERERGDRDRGRSEDSAEASLPGLPSGVSRERTSTGLDDTQRDRDARRGDRTERVRGERAPLRPPPRLDDVKKKSEDTPKQRDSAALGRSEREEGGVARQQSAAGVRPEEEMEKRREDESERQQKQQQQQAASGPQRIETEAGKGPSSAAERLPSPPSVSTAKAASPSVAPSAAAGDKQRGNTASSPASSPKALPPASAAVAEPAKLSADPNAERSPVGFQKPSALGLPTQPGMGMGVGGSPRETAAQSIVGFLGGSPREGDNIFLDEGSNEGHGMHSILETVLGKKLGEASPDAAQNLDGAAFFPMHRSSPMHGGTNAARGQPQPQIGPTPDRSISAIGPYTSQQNRQAMPEDAQPQPMERQRTDPVGSHQQQHPQPSGGAPLQHIRSHHPHHASPQRPDLMGPAIAPLLSRGPAHAHQQQPELPHQQHLPQQQAGDTPQHFNALLRKLSQGQQQAVPSQQHHGLPQQLQPQPQAMIRSPDQGRDINLATHLAQQLHHPSQQQQPQQGFWPDAGATARGGKVDNAHGHPPVGGHADLGTHPQGAAAHQQHPDPMNYFPRMQSQQQQQQPGGGGHFVTPQPHPSSAAQHIASPPPAPIFRSLPHHQALPDPSDLFHDMMAEKIWVYRDPSGEIQGPFETQKMLDWTAGNYLPSDLPLATVFTQHHTPNAFVPLETLFQDVSAFSKMPLTVVVDLFRRLYPNIPALPPYMADIVIPAELARYHQQQQQQQQLYARQQQQQQQQHAQPSPQPQQQPGFFGGTFAQHHQGMPQQQQQPQWAQPGIPQQQQQQQHGGAPRVEDRSHATSPDFHPHTQMPQQQQVPPHSQHPPQHSSHMWAGMRGGPGEVPHGPQTTEGPAETGARGGPLVGGARPVPESVHAELPRGPPNRLMEPDMADRDLRADLRMPGERERTGGVPSPTNPQQMHAGALTGDGPGSSPPAQHQTVVPSRHFGGLLPEASGGHASAVRTPSLNTPVPAAQQQHGREGLLPTSAHGSLYAGSQTSTPSGADVGMLKGGSLLQMEGQREREALNNAKDRERAAAGAGASGISAAGLRDPAILSYTQGEKTHVLKQQKKAKEKAKPKGSGAKDGETAGEMSGRERAERERGDRDHQSPSATSAHTQSVGSVAPSASTAAAMPLASRNAAGGNLGVGGGKAPGTPSGAGAPVATQHVYVVKGSMPGANVVSPAAVAERERDREKEPIVGERDVGFEVVRGGAAARQGGRERNNENRRGQTNAGATPQGKAHGLGFPEEAQFTAGSKLTPSPSMQAQQQQSKEVGRDREMTIPLAAAVDPKGYREKEAAMKAGGASIAPWAEAHQQLGGAVSSVAPLDEFPDAELAKSKGAKKEKGAVAGGRIPAAAAAGGKKVPLGELMKQQKQEEAAAGKAGASSVWKTPVGYAGADFTDAAFSAGLIGHSPSGVPKMVVANTTSNARKKSDAVNVVASSQPNPSSAQGGGAGQQQQQDKRQQGTATPGGGKGQAQLPRDAQGGGKRGSQSGDGERPRPSVDMRELASIKADNDLEIDEPVLTFLASMVTEGNVTNAEGVAELLVDNFAHDPVLQQRARKFSRDLFVYVSTGRKPQPQSQSSSGAGGGGGGGGGRRASGGGNVAQGGAGEKDRQERDTEWVTVKGGAQGEMKGARAGAKRKAKGRAGSGGEGAS